MSAERSSADRPDSGGASLHPGSTLFCGFAVALLTTAVRADNFANAYYDARRDQVVVTVTYRGTGRARGRGNPLRLSGRRHLESVR